MKYLLILLTSCFPITLSAQSIETVIQKGHELAVIAVAISPDSNYVATGSRDKTIKLWELSSGREVRSFLGHETSVNAIDFSRDGKYLISSSTDKTARLWEVATGKLLFTSEEQKDFLTDVAISPNGKYFVAAGYPDSAIVVDIAAKKIVKKIGVNADQGLGSGVNISFSPDGNWIAFGEDNRTATVYQTNTWKQVYKFQKEEGWCGGCGTQVVFGRDSKSFFMASHNGEVKSYDLADGKLKHMYMENVDELRSIDVSHDNQTLLVSTKTDASVWDIHSGKELAKINPASNEDLNEACFTIDGKSIIFTSNENTAAIWNIKQNKATRLLTGFLNQRDKGGITYNYNDMWERDIYDYIRFKNNLLITTDGTELIKGKFGKKLKRWNMATGKTSMEYVGHQKGVVCYALSSDGKRLLSGGGDGKLVVWDVVKGDTLQSIQSYDHPVLDVHFNADETQIISSSWDGTMKIHDIKSGKRIHYFDFDRQLGSAYNVLWSPNDLYVFSSHGKFLKMWEVDTHAEVRNFVGHSELISSLSLSADGKTLMSTSRDGSARLWDIGTGLMTRKMVNDGATHAGIFSADSKSIYTAGSDRLIRQWDIATSKVIRVFEGHKSDISTLRLHPNGKMLISYSVDGSTKFWDLQSGKEFFEHIHFGERDWMVKNPEGYFNGTDNARQYIHFVDGMKTYSVDQFFDEFYRPDLLPKIFTERGGVEDNKGVQGKLNQSPPPFVKVAALLSSDPTKAEVFIKMTDRGAGVKELKLFHNGKRVAVSSEVIFPKGKDQSTTVKASVSLVGGTNTFTATATNQDRVESDPAAVELFSETSSKNSTCYILAVGINQYKNSKLTLSYAKPDAESFGKVMDEKGKLFKNVVMKTLYDADASKSSILAALDELSTKINQEDVFIFYYAGHGSMVDNQFFFIPTESSRLYDLSSLRKEAIEASVLQEKFRAIKALKQLIVMDACQSGGSVELLANRGAAEEKAIAQLSRSAGIHVMASAGSEQFATEFAELGHGLFTYLLIKALQGDADGSPKDGKVTIYELKSYLDDQVPEMTRKLKGKPQYPYTFSRGQDFPVVIEN
ncbi:MAG: caspase family protein [Bacteroidetes bacterium]|nr:caspase family protein [Bacteroidota bacterium]